MANTVPPDNVSTETIMGILRSLISGIGGALMLFGIVNSDQLATWMNIIITTVGALIPVGVSIWSAVHHVTKNDPNTPTVP
jgi:uncharacterized membrane protein